MEITINFTYPIQDSVSVGDTAYYVYAHESGGFDVNSSSVVEIGEILSIQRNGVNGGTIVCDTELYGNELQLGCGGSGTSADCVDSDRTTTSSPQTTTTTTVTTEIANAETDCNINFATYTQQSMQLTSQLTALHQEYVYLPSPNSASTLYNLIDPPNFNQTVTDEDGGDGEITYSDIINGIWDHIESLEQELMELTTAAWECGACLEYPTPNCCHLFDSWGMTFENEKQAYLNFHSANDNGQVQTAAGNFITPYLTQWYDARIAFVQEVSALACNGISQEVTQDPPAAVTSSEPTSSECGDPFILFSKNNCQNLKSLLGYYSLFRFRNDSKEKAELFNITVDAYESSK